MQKFMIVLFNLKEDVSPEDYEKFVAEEDAPVVRQLPSVVDMKVNRVVGTMDGAPAPYQYMELITITDFEQLGADAQAQAVQEVAGKFQTMVDGKPVFLFQEQFA